MAYYLVRAKPHHLTELRAELDNGEIAKLRPFGSTMHASLLNARLDSEGFATWEEQCFCSPPLAQERSVLDVYFTDLTTETVSHGVGWSKINHLPSLWAD
mgnify:CR=1 FL=1